MAARSSAAAKPSENALFIERIFDAPRDLVWKAWAEPERMAHWAGPRGSTMTWCELGSGPGEPFGMDIRSPEGTIVRVRGVYREIVPAERLVYTWAFLDEHGHPGHETLVTVTFADLGQKTRLTLHQAMFDSVAARDGHHDGWSSALDCLAEYLATA